MLRGAVLAKAMPGDQPLLLDPRSIFKPGGSAARIVLIAVPLGATACRKTNEYLLVGMFVKEKPVIVTPHAQFAVEITMI